MSYYVDPPRNLQIIPTQPTYKLVHMLILRSPPTDSLPLKHRVCPLRDFFYIKFGLGSYSQTRTLVPNLAIVTFKM